MPVPLLDLPAEYASLQAEIDEVVHEVLASAAFIGGARVREIEERITAYCGTKHAVSCASGTDALVLILESLGISAGDEVITSPYTFFATAEAISRVGARPVFVDIEPDTYNIDASAIEAAVTPRTKAIVPVHLFGQCADMDDVHDVAERHGLAIVEDACQAIGAEYRARKAGSLGRAAAFSFFPSKNLGAAGDGGMITTDDAELAATARLLANHGSSEKYLHRSVGYNSRLDALQAAILSVKLPRLDAWNEHRRAAAERYSELLSGLPLALPTIRPECTSVYHLYIVRVEDGRGLVKALAARGIGCGLYYPKALHLQPAYAGLGYREGDLPNAEAAQGHTVAIPCFPGITQEQQAEVAEAVRAVLGES